MLDSIFTAFKGAADFICARKKQVRRIANAFVLTAAMLCGTHLAFAPNALALDATHFTVQELQDEITALNSHTTHWKKAKIKKVRNHVHKARAKPVSKKRSTKPKSVNDLIAEDLAKAYKELKANEVQSNQSSTISSSSISSSSNNSIEGPAVYLTNKPSKAAPTKQERLQQYLRQDSKPVTTYKSSFAFTHFGFSSNKTVEENQFQAVYRQDVEEGRHVYGINIESYRDHDKTTGIQSIILGKEFIDNSKFFHDKSFYLGLGAQNVVNPLDSSGKPSTDAQAYASLKCSDNFGYHFDVNLFGSKIGPTLLFTDMAAFGTDDIVVSLAGGFVLGDRKAVWKYGLPGAAPEGFAFYLLGGTRINPFSVRKVDANLFQPITTGGVSVPLTDRVNINASGDYAWGPDSYTDADKRMGVKPPKTTFRSLLGIVFKF